MNGIEKVLEALEPFYQERRITQKECFEYLGEIQSALASYGITLYKEEVKDKHIRGENSIIQLSQKIQPDAAQINLARLDRRKAFEMKMTVFSQYDQELRVYIPKVLEVQRQGNQTHNYYW